MSDKELLSSLTRQLAKADLPAEHTEALAKMVSNLRHKPIGIDICKYGICLDLLVEGGLEALDMRELEELAPGKIRDIEIFPWGIIRPDLMQVRVAQQFF